MWCAEVQHSSAWYFKHPDTISSSFHLLFTHPSTSLLVSSLLSPSHPLPPSPCSSDLASTMRTVEHPVDFLYPPHRSIWNVSQVQSLLDDLAPNKSNIFFANPSLVYDNETAYPSVHGNCTHPTAAHHDFNVSSADQIEPYFNTMYAIYCTDTRLIQKWNTPDIPEGTFDLPDFETYVPHNLTLLPLPADHSKVPQLAHDDNQGEC